VLVVTRFKTEDRPGAGQRQRLRPRRSGLDPRSLPRPPHEPPPESRLRLRQQL
jgi:hypothetical protein